MSRRASDIKSKWREPLWHGRIPVGALTVIAGPPAKGKSTLGYRIAADLKVPALFITWEESFEEVWRPRLEASGVDLDKAWHHPEIKFAPRWRPTFRGINPTPEEHRLGTLKKLIQEYGAKVVFVDPITRHLQGAAIHREDQVANVLAPYLAMIEELGVALVAEVHVLRSVSTKSHPLLAVPAGLVTVAKAVYLFGPDPTLGADPNIRVLACTDKFNFGEIPRSLAFEFATRSVPVLDEASGETVMKDFPVWLPRGETNVSAKTLLVMLAPETSERKSDKIAHVLLGLLRDGARPVVEIRRTTDELDPRVSWRTVQRVAEEMGIVVEDDPRDARFKIWSLPPETLQTLEEITTPDDEIQLKEVDLPDTVPEEWGEPPEEDDDE